MIGTDVLTGQCADGAYEPKLKKLGCTRLPIRFASHSVDTVTCAEREAPVSGQLGHRLKPASICRLTSGDAIRKPVIGKLG